MNILTDTKITKDKFLNGKIMIYQYHNYYKAGIDSILLASIVKSKQNDSILDLGMGVGTVSLAIASRLKNVAIYGLEKEELFFNLAKENKSLNQDILKSNNNTFEPVLGNIINNDTNIPTNFNIVVANPPYFKLTSTHSSSKDGKARDVANIEQDATLEDFISFAFKHLKHGGDVYIINKTERLKETLDLLKIKHFGNIQIYPIYSFINKSASRFIVSAKKSSKALSQLHFGIIMHNEDKSYSNHANNILKKGLDFFSY